MFRKTIFKIQPIVLSLLVSTAHAGQAQAPVSPALPQLVRTIHGVSEYKLANGLDVLLFPDSSETRVTVHVVYKVGSRYESYGETGMAHLLEHLMFKGTSTRTNIPKEQADHNAAFNAKTGFDTTEYFEMFPASKPNLDWALGLEADRMVNSSIAKRDLDTEMTVVRNEFESKSNSAPAVLEERVFETAYLWHNYSHPPIGSRSDIEKVPIERLQAFYRTYYQPDNATVIIAGQFDKKAALSELTQTFGKIARPARVLPAPYTEEPTQDGEREVTLRRVSGLKMIYAGYHIPPAMHPDTVALEILSQILGDGPTSRLYKQLVETKLATGERVEAQVLHDAGMMLFEAQTAETGDLDVLHKKLIAIIDGIATEPITQAELDRVRDKDTRRIEHAFDSSLDIASALGDDIGQGDWRQMFWERDLEKTITVADLQRVALRYLIPSNLTIGLLIPEAKPMRAVIPPPADLAATLLHYDGEPGAAQIAAFDPTPKNIEAHTVHTSAGPLKLDILNKPTKNDRLFVNIHLHYGDEASLRGKAMDVTFANGLLGSGSKKYTRISFQDELTRTDSQIHFQILRGLLSVNILTPKANLTHALEMTAEMLEEPVFDPKEFEEGKLSSLSGANQQKTDPGTLSAIELFRRIAPYPKDHIYYLPTPDESRERLEALRLDDITAFYKQFMGASYGEVAIVGQVDPATVSNEFTRLFGNWKTRLPYRHVPRVYSPTKPEDLTFNIPDKQNAVFRAGTALDMGEDNPDFSALMIGDRLFGGGSMNARLAKRIRQQEGLSYTVLSSLDVEEQDASGLFTVFAISAPQNELKVAAAFRDELDKARSEEFSKQEVEDTKLEILKARQLSRASDPSLSHYLVSHLYLGRDERWEEVSDQKLEAVTPAQIHSAIKRYVDPRHIVTVTAGDFKATSIQFQK